jgi:hypothetical protein
VPYLFIVIHRIKIPLLLLVGVFVTQIVFGQLRRFPHPSPATKSQPKTSKPSGRPQELIQRSLPFWDDFAGTPVNNTTANSNYPVDSLWVNNKSVWISNSLGINSPSINVATLDGLDSAFLPYSDQILTNGIGDSLVSQGIKLSEPDVAIGERNSVYLSFFYQWQGNGEAPDDTDYLLVEFKNDQQAWEPVMTIYPKVSFDRTVFYDTLINVNGDRFFHDTFQFRFRSYGKQSGPYDTWNIDYVYLNKNRTVNDTDFPDQAIASPLTNLFSGYHSIPYGHLLNMNSITPPTFLVSNNLDEFTDLTYLTEGTFSNYKDGNLNINYFGNLGGSDTSAINNDGSGIIFPLEKRTVTLEYVPDPGNSAQFDPLADSVWINLKVKLFTGDTFDPKDGSIANDYDLNYLPIDFRSNDTTNARYFLKDYYAYDDGIAEYSAGLTQPGNRVAVLFDMLTSTVDTLVGIDIYVPDYGLTSNLTADFYVYRDDGGMPGDILYVIPSFSIRRRGQNTFQRIRILEPFLVETKFYIGWRAPVGATLKVGLDATNNSSDKIFVNTNGSWTQNDDLNGSLMIRPVFGSGEIITRVPEDEVPIRIFPNPNHGDFYIDGEFDSLQVLSITGQSIPFESEQNGNTQRIRLKYAASGIYLVKLQHGSHFEVRKIIIR